MTGGIDQNSDHGGSIERATYGDRIELAQQLYNLISADKDRKIERKLGGIGAYLRKQGFDYSNDKILSVLGFMVAKGALGVKDSPFGKSYETIGPRPTE